MLAQQGRLTSALQRTRPSVPPSLWNMAPFITVIGVDPVKRVNRP